MEAVTIAHHASLRRRWSRNAVPTARRRGRLRCRRQGGARSDDTNTKIRIRPKPRALGANGGIPGYQLRERDAVGGPNRGTSLA